MPPKPHLILSYSNCRKPNTKDLEKSKEGVGVVLRPRGWWNVNLTYKGTMIRITTDFSESMQARREWSEISKVLKEKNHQHRINEKTH